MLKPAPTGLGYCAGGAVRVVLKWPSAKWVSKIFGSNNKINNAKATLRP